MAVSQRITTTVSTKGQVILPKAVRQSLGWEAGTRLVVEAGILAEARRRHRG